MGVLMLGNPFVLTASEKEDIRQSLLKLKEKLPKDLGVSYIESRSEKRIRSEISQNPTLCELIDAIGSEFISPKQDIRSLGSSITNCLAAIFTLQKTETVTNLLKYSGIIELIRISYMFEYLAQEVNPDPLFLDDLFNAYTNIVSGTFIGNHINPKLKSLLPIVKRMMDATELMRMTHEKSSLKIDEIQKLIPLLNQQVSTSESNIALIYNENNYTQFDNDPSVLSELVQSVDAIAKQEKPRTQFIIFPNHKLLHVTSIDVRWNPQSKRLEFTSIDFTNNPAIKYLALELLARYQNASFYLCMTEYQKDPFGCRLYSLLACKDIYPHFNHQMLESAPVISQPEVTKIGSKKLNALLHTALDEKMLIGLPRKHLDLA